MSLDNPCLSCGAFSECVSSGGVVPDALSVQVGPFHVAMLGTERKPVRCVGLLGKIGCSVRCTLYEQRSTICREFEAAWVDGQPNAHCDAARVAQGLPPLQSQVSAERAA